jgi:penicillin-binding protein 1B
MPSDKAKPSAAKKTKSSASAKAKVTKRSARRPSKKKKTRFIKRTTIIPVLVVSLILFLGYLFYLDQRITERFEGRIWQLPAHVYARPLELYVGKSISTKQILFELDYLNYQKVDGLPQRPAQYRNWKDVFEIKTRDFIFWDGEEDSHTIRVTIKDDKVTELINLYTTQDVDLVRFDAGYLTGIFPSHSQDRVLLKLDDVPDIFIKMLLLVEDRRFFTHWGVDPLSIGRALLVNVSSGRTVQGGSTLTQQLVKNLFLTQDKTIVRKINEAFMSLLLELHYDKMLILETYINEIYLGQDGRRAIHGFGLASEFYFGKSLKQLSIDEMAVLVGMVKGASYYNPKRNPDNARERRDIVLTSMQQVELITPRQKEKLSAKPVVTVKHASSGLYPAFIDMVKLQLQQDYQTDDLQSEGLRVFTTLDPYIQFNTEQAIVNTLPRLSNNEDLQAAAVVVSPSNGDVLAVVGGRNPSYKGFNRALNAERQVGSLIKPVIYLAALQDPSRYTLSTILDDSEFSYTTPGRPDWKPQNYDKEYHGEVTLYEALLKSYNLPAVRTGIDIGLDNVIDTLSALGSKKSVSALPSITLGAIDMSPVEVATVYQSFSANGFHSPLRSVHAVLDKDRQPLERYSLEVDNQVKPEAIVLVNSALIDVTKFGTARRLADRLSIQVAGKTGTSDDLRDSWFAGFSGDVMAVIWTGYDDNRPTTLTGSSGAMKIWGNLIKEVAYKSYQVPEMPGLVRSLVNAKDGLLTEKACENAVELLFIEGSQPQQTSDCVGGSSGNWFLNLFN